MKKLVYPSLALSIFLFSNAATAQTDLAIGQWKAHLPFKAGIHVTQSAERVFYATRQAVLAIDKADHAIERITKVEGLSRVGVSLVKYNAGSRILLVVYDNGVIDLLSDDDGSIRSLPNLPASNIVLGEKKVFDVTMANDSIAYLAANYGVTTLNLRRGLFPNTVKTPVEVRNVQVFQNRLFAATPEGIYTIDPAGGTNVDDFANWSLLGEESGFPQDYGSKAMAVFNQKLYAGVNDSLYVFDGASAQYVHHQDTLPLTFLTAEGSHLLAGFRCEKAGCFGKILIFEADNSHRQAPAGCVAVPLYAIEDAQGNLWFADDGGFFRVSAGGTSNCEWIAANGPFSDHVRRIAVHDHQVWVASGGINLQFSGLLWRDGFFSLIGGEWTSYSSFGQVPEIAELVDFVDIAVHPETGKVYASSYYDGLVEFDPATGTFTVFNETNSSLEFATEDLTRTRAAGIAFDEDNNLWVCNHFSPRPLSVLKNDGSWQNFDLSCTSETGMLEIAVDAFGYKWVTASNGGFGILVFDSGDLADPADDRCKIINTANSVLPNNEVSAVAVDLDGAVWVGTKEGAAVFQCDPFGDCPGSRPFVTVDGFGANLLEDQDVRAIGVDGANRKWFGALTGLFVQSPDGGEQVAKFTAENSPLFDNGITDVAFDHETGEVFIGTAKGLVSFRSDATGAEDFHSGSGVKVFPNPVRPGYEGPIAIEGLARDATVKITDTSGQLVFETEALGGQAIWDGRDDTGRKAATGVYIVFATSRSSSNPDVAVARILLVN